MITDHYTFSHQMSHQLRGLSRGEVPIVSIISTQCLFVLNKMADSQEVGNHIPVYPETDDSKHRVSILNHGIHPDKLKPGDHIYVYRTSGTYAHHAIYTGKNKSGIHIVIHFSGDAGTKKSKSTAKIRKASLDEFLDGADLRLVSYDDLLTMFKKSGTSHVLESLPASEVVETAERYCMNPDAWKDYHLLNNNCEHFCIFCKTGKKVGDCIIQDQWCGI